MTVAAELAVALHHSRDVGPGTHVGLRAQKTASSGGRRPGVLKEPVPPVVVEHATRPLRGSSSRHPVSGWWRRWCGRHDHAVPPQEGHLEEERGGGGESEEGEGGAGEGGP